MKRILHMFPSLLLVLLLLGCGREPDATVPPVTPPPTVTTVPETTVPETAIPETTVPETTVPEHSALYIPGVEVEDVILWFNEVVLDCEFTYGGDASLVQKWDVPLIYHIEGNATAEDLQVLEAFAAWLNTVEGFPGMYPADAHSFANLNIYFGSARMILDRMGPDYENVDGGIRYWYSDNAIYDAIVCYRDDISQYTRNSVILEEIYNGLGLTQDTILREDSIIWQSYSEPQELTPVDKLLLQLLYHPDIRCGMNAAECEAVIRELYY